jgi:tetraacyldisaccharide 4'-kinase
LGLFSAVYRAALSAREYSYKKGWKKPKKLPQKVVSVGNLTLGGTGKTPAVISLTLEAKERGFKPCILTRGYKGKTKGPCLSSKDSKHFLKTNLVGDEAAFMAYRLHDVPVVKGKNRFLAGIHALGELGADAIDVFLLDDGFQHRALHRDIDVLLIDATNPFGNERLFPEGRLRETFESMKRAEIIVITKSDAASEEEIKFIEDKIKQCSPASAVYHAKYEPLSLIDISGKEHPLDLLTKKKIFVFAGIVNASYFRSIVKSQGADIVDFRDFRDHYFYKQRDINKIEKEAQGMDIITTEKDMVKLKDLRLTANIFALRIEFVVEKGFYEQVFNAIV